jgi:glutamyl-tRNA reductase
VYAFGSGDTAGRILDTVFAPRVPAGSDWLYRLHQRDTVEHLYRVASGLDSMVVGEHQILGQVRKAYELSRTASSLGAVLHRLAAGALRVGKRVRTETDISAGAVSVASIAVELAEKVLGDMRGKRALLVGAGDNAEVVAQHLNSRRVASLTIVNRTFERAEVLAEQLGGDCAPWGDLTAELARADVVVSTTGASEPVIDRALLEPVMRMREQRALVLLDIAVPRDVHPEVDDLASVFRFDMDAFDEIVAANLERRRHEIPRVEALIDREVDTFVTWWSSLDAGPVIRGLHQSFESVRASAFAENAYRFADEDQEQLDVFSRHLVRKLLTGVTQEIKRYRRDDPVHMERLASLRTVFHLDDGPEEP